MNNWMKRKFLMLRMATTFLGSNGGLKRAELMRKSGLFHAIGEKCYWHPLKIPADMKAFHMGNNVTVCADVDFITHDLNHRLFNNRGTEKIPYYFAPIKIDDNVMIGAHSIIMYNVHVESNTIIAAGSVVTKDVKEGTIVGGNPARVIGYTDKLYEKRLVLKDKMPKSNNDEAGIETIFWNGKCM